MAQNAFDVVDFAMCSFDKCWCGYGFPISVLEGLKGAVLLGDVEDDKAERLKGGGVSEGCNLTDITEYGRMLVRIGFLADRPRTERQTH